MENWFAIVIGLILLVIGGELLVRGAVKLAERMGISPLIIGLTLVGFGTSTPELVTSVQAGLAGATGVAYGNIVGSNIANILLIGGVSAILTPIIVARSALQRDVVVMVFASLVFTAWAIFLPMGRIAGLGLITGLIGYLTFTVMQERRNAVMGAIYDKSQALAGADPTIATASDNGSILKWTLVTIGGLAVVILGGNFLVTGAVALARDLGISESVIGLTIVAVGTSLPELITSVIAAIKRQGDIAFGNIVGSNIYNILGIGGVTALIAPSDVPQAIAHFDAPLMVGVSLLMVVFAITGLRIARSEGVVLLAAYFGYMWYIWG